VIAFRRDAICHSKRRSEGWKGRLGAEKQDTTSHQLLEKHSFTKAHPFRFVFDFQQPGFCMTTLQIPPSKEGAECHRYVSSNRIPKTELERGTPAIAWFDKIALVRWPT
jgi:hypothetical protein